MGGLGVSLTLTATSAATIEYVSVICFIHELHYGSQSQTIAGAVDCVSSWKIGQCAQKHQNKTLGSLDDDDVVRRSLHPPCHVTYFRVCY